MTRTLTTDAASAEPPPIYRVGASGRPEALAVLLTGKANPSDPAVATFLAYAAEHSLSLEHLWAAGSGGAAGRGGKAAAAVLVIPGPGRTAVVFMSPVDRRSDVALHAAVARAAVAPLDGGRFAMVQCLLEPGEAVKGRVLEAAGFRFLAELVHMHRSVRRVADPGPLTVGGRALVETRWSEAARPAFAGAIGATYVDTLDCPGLLGLREMDDIIAGHMASGRFKPKLWSVWHDLGGGEGGGVGGEPAAVLLVSGSVQHGGHELVYLGVAERYRGRGLGRRLVEEALHRVHADGGGELHLAVDRRNTPAVRLYREAGFRNADRKTAYIFTP